MPRSGVTRGGPRLSGATASWLHSPQSIGGDRSGRVRRLPMLARRDPHTLRPLGLDIGGDYISVGAIWPRCATLPGLCPKKIGVVPRTSGGEAGLCRASLPRRWAGPHPHTLGRVSRSADGGADQRQWTMSERKGRRAGCLPPRAGLCISRPLDCVHRPHPSWLRQRHEGRVAGWKRPPGPGCTRLISGGGSGRVSYSPCCLGSRPVACAIGPSGLGPLVPGGSAGQPFPRG